jgi:hypothetical protein
LKTIEVSDNAFDKISFAAAIAGISIAVAVDRMVEKSTASLQDASGVSDAEASTDEVAISVTYRGKRVSGFLNPATDRLRITEAPIASLIGIYRTPSNAAVETVKALNPARQHPATNGWRFWVDNDGHLIDRHRQRHN